MSPFLFGCQFMLVNLLIYRPYSSLVAYILELFLGEKILQGTCFGENTRALMGHVHA